jgi:hypothetical protein
MRLRHLPRASRAFDVLSPVSVYRVAGRRPSAVRVDGSMQPTLSDAAPHRLSDLVFDVVEAQPADEIQEHGSGLILVTADGQSHAISMAPPRPLEPATAFTHAERSIKADLAVIDELMRAKALVEMEPRKRATPPRPPREEFGEDHPLVIGQHAAAT